MQSFVRDRVRGMMLGAAIGDALGAAFEFVPSATILSTVGTDLRGYANALPGSLLRSHPRGMPTDDTAMALSLATALSSGAPVTGETIAKGFSADLQHGGRFASMYWNGGPGGTCNRMLSALASGKRPFEGIDPNAGANGAAMRAHPCGVLSERAAVAPLASMQARLSHPHPGAIASAQVIALTVHEALHHGRFMSEFPDEAEDADMRAAWTTMHANIGRSSTGLPRELRDVDLAGWNTVAAAHAIAAMYVDDFEKGIVAAATSGKDTDTVAGMVGAMLGALHGANAIPPNWIEELQYRADIEEVADRLFDASVRGIEVVS